MLREPQAAIVVDEFAPARKHLRIAIVTETYPPEVNGVAATIACTIEGLRARQHHVQLVRPRQGGGDTGQEHEAFHEVLLRGLPIPRYPHLKMGLPATRALVRLWSLHRPDIVHVVTEGPLGWSALQAASRLKLPISSDFRTNFHAYGKHYGIGWLYKPLISYLRKFHNRTQLTMVPTESLRSDLAVQGFENLKVVARGVDAERFTPSRRSQSLRESWGAGPDTPVVVHVGRIAPEKNLDVLMVAFEAMRVVQPDLKLVMVGDGPMREELARRHPNVLFAGARKGTDLAAHYASGDMFLFPSVTETFGNVTPEAMASGLAVLAYDYAAAGTLIQPGRNGMLAAFDQPADFVRQAVRLAQDLDLARKLGTQARETAAAMSWPTIVAEQEALMLNVVQSHASALDNATRPSRTQALRRPAGA